ncbi:ATP-dependent helicase [Geotoga petraea]|jgi:DNA helicase-2/ATP-dependent DNA helicase PcrA|uniref:DNA 3'-5' helicase n=1 Tax=Geotoga petraea TaxID=28234 RepID=A0A1G6I1R4_9BACT|nr:ATP-dependent helicase [Geotoga petraea]MDK2945444.1 ATP-dependent helicase UvrD/PcrA [Geotoga sp.]TGG89061.1 ATP-dependent helicase [Geotoga petraea]SDC00499.1 DNA helicase-2 / ATP-dependent DNA helicase PcrA [Geotoga petraea]
MEEDKKIFEIKKEIPKFLKDNLDEEQLDAVINSNGNSLIIAGPGSGKTRVITYKIAYLLSQGVKPSEIMLVTFTRAAAKQMTDRIRNVTDQDLTGITAGTFHHVCNGILRRYAKAIGYENNFSILDSEDSKDLLKIIRNEYKEGMGEDAKKFPKESVIQKVISYASNTLKSIRESILEIAPYLIDYENDIEHIWGNYQEMKKNINAMDYDDLLVNTAHLLSFNKKALNDIASKYKYVLVDEFQDTNKIQLEIVQAISSYSKNLIVVGDDSQSIYSFRGARYENIEEFIKRDDTKLFKIQTNYRSTPNIVSFINNMLPNNSVEKNLKSVRKEYVKPNIIETFDDLEQSEAVIKIIEEKIDQDVDLNEIAVLYRSHALSMTLQQKLDSQQIPYRLLSGKRFIETKHIKDVLSFLKILYNPYDNISWNRSLKLFSGIGVKTATDIYKSITSQFKEGINMLEAFKNSKLKKFKEAYEFYKKLFEKDKNKPDEIINFIFNEFYKEYSNLTFRNSASRNMDIERFQDISSQYESLMKFLEEMTLSENITVKSAERDQKEDQITLTTVHGAKGLEWKVVILLSVNPGDFPNGMAIKEKKLDEEERLFYVAITRAKDELYILKQITGSTNPFMSNSYVFVKKEYDFIKNIPENLVETFKTSYKY